MVVQLLRCHLLAIALLIAGAPARAAETSLEVWKNRGCGCCSAWADHLRAAGLTVVVHEVEDVAAIRAAAGVPPDLGACHTAEVAGYLVEGHVPAAHILRLLAERPSIRGLAVPGMPIGSPGMEVPGSPGEPFVVIAFAADGSRYPFD
jgi:hypothetical protein